MSRWLACGLSFDLRWVRGIEESAVRAASPPNGGLGGRCDPISSHGVWAAQGPRRASRRERRCDLLLEHETVTARSCTSSSAPFFPPPVPAKRTLAWQLRTAKTKLCLRRVWPRDRPDPLPIAAERTVDLIGRSVARLRTRERHGRRAGQPLSLISRGTPSALGSGAASVALVVSCEHREKVLSAGAACGCGLPLERCGHPMPESSRPRWATKRMHGPRVRPRCATRDLTFTTQTVPAELATKLECSHDRRSCSS